MKLSLVFAITQFIILDDGHFHKMGYILRTANATQIVNET